MTRIISNSEVEDMNKCERLHYFKHGLRLTRDNYGQSEALQIGIIGHDIMATFFKLTKDGVPYIEAVDAAFKLLDREWDEDDIPAKVDVILRDRITRFFLKAKSMSWNVLAVEEKYELPMAQDWSFGMRLDILAELTTGEYKGKLAIVDWKFTQNFMSDWHVLLHTQLKKYKWTLNQLNIPVAEIFLAQLRTHKAAVEKFELRRVVTNSVQEEFLMEEHEKTAQHIMQFRSMHLDDWAKKARYAFNRQNCDYCGFAKICTARIKGEDTDLVIQANYVTDTYGYNNVIIEPDVEFVE